MILRELFLKLGLEVDEAAFAKGQLAAGLVEAALHKIVDIGKEVVESFWENTKEAIEYGDKITKTSQSIGIATDALQELQYAGKLADLSAEEMSQSIGLLSRKMNEAKTGSEEAGKAFKGIAFKKDGKLLETEAVLNNIADLFQKMPDGPEKTAKAMQLFGRAGKQMIPLLNKGSEDLEAMRQEARDLGLVMDVEVAKSAEELNDNLTRLSMISKGLWRGAIAPLIPEMGRLVEKFLRWRKANAELLRGKLEGFIRFLVKGVEILGAVFDDLITILGGVKTVLFAIGKVAYDVVTHYFSELGTVGKAAAIALAAAWAIAAAPFLAIAAVIAEVFLLFDDINAYLHGRKSAYGYFKKELEEWTKPKKGEHYLTTWFKDLIRYIMEAIELLKEMDEIFGDGTKARAWAEKKAAKNKKQVDAEADSTTLKTARQRVGQGLPLTDQEKAALGRAGVPEDSFVKNYGPGGAGFAREHTNAAGPWAAAPGATPGISLPPDMMPQQPAPGSGVLMTNNNQNTINVTQRDGEDSGDFARRVVEEFDKQFQAQVEAAGGGVRR